MTFLINNLFLFIKFFLFILIKIMLFENTFAKILAIIFLIIILCILFSYPKKRFHKLSKLRSYRVHLIKKYGLYTKTQHLYNIILISLYSVFLTTLIFYWRFLNKDKIINLNQYYKFFCQWIQENSSLELFVNILLYLILLILYFVVLIKIINYFKYHIIKRHLYFMNRIRNEWYYLTFFHDVLFKFYIPALVMKIVALIEYLYRHLYFKYQTKDYGLNYDSLPFEEQVEISLKSPVDPDSLSNKYRWLYSVTYYTLKYWHYCLLLIVIFYDISFNCFVITKIFYILPYTFFYELYVRLSTFIDNLHLPYDENFSDFVYAHHMEVINKDTLLLDGTFVDYNYFKRLYHTYVKRNFIKDRDDIFG